MLDKEKRIRQIAARYGGRADLELVRQRFTTRPLPAREDRAQGRGFRVSLGYTERINNPPRSPLKRKHRLRLRYAERERQAQAKK